MDPPKMKGVKKKKSDGLTTDNIDSSAPVKKIVDDLEVTNHQAFQFLKINRQPRYYNQSAMMNKHYIMPGHQLAAFPEDWEGDLSPDYFQAFRYKSMMPKMITAMANQLKKDPLAEFLELKQNWFTELKNQKLANCKCSTIVCSNTEFVNEIASKCIATEQGSFLKDPCSVPPCTKCPNDVPTYLQCWEMCRFIIWLVKVPSWPTANLLTCYKVPLTYKITEHSDEVVSCPKHFIDMAKHMESDPDPYFGSSYNWYYAGNGNLQLIYVNHKEYLMCSEFHLCYIFEFNRTELTYNRDAATVFDCGEGNNICEGICSSHDVIALRTKHKVFVLKIVLSDDKIEIQKLKVSESIKPYTGISFDDYHTNILYVTDLNNLLKIVNLDRLTARTVELKNSVTSLVNNWNTVIGNERGYYTHVASNAVTLYDKRINSSVRRWSNPNRVSDYAWCNSISAAKYSPRSPYLYLATNHHLFLMDMRYQKNFSLKPMQRWTHGMKCFPTYISICSFEHDKELVCLSSQWCEDTCVVPNHLQKDLNEPEYKGVTIPYRLPSILQTLSDARLLSLCTDVYKLIENRLVTALTGNLVLRHEDKYVVLSQNSLGDVASHLLYPEHMKTFVEEDGLQALHEWSQGYEIENKDLVVSGVWDISEFWKSLARVPDGAINRRYENEKSNYNEQEVLDAFENEELDDGLLDVWLDDEATGLNDEATRLDDTEDKSALSLSLNITADAD